MAEENKFKVKIGEEVREIIVGEPRGKDRIRFVKLLDDVDKTEDGFGYLTALDELLKKYSGLTQEEVDDMALVDKDAVISFLFGRVMNFLSQIKAITKN